MMKLTVRSIFWTVVAAVFTVPVVNMWMSLGPDERAVLATVVVMVVFVAFPAVLLVQSAMRRQERRANGDEDVVDGQARNLDAYVRGKSGCMPVADGKPCRLRSRARRCPRRIRPRAGHQCRYRTTDGGGTEYVNRATRGGATMKRQQVQCQRPDCRARRASLAACAGWRPELQPQRMPYQVDKVGNQFELTTTAAAVPIHAACAGHH